MACEIARFASRRSNLHHFRLRLRHTGSILRGHPIGGWQFFFIKKTPVELGFSGMIHYVTEFVIHAKSLIFGVIMQWHVTIFGVRQRAIRCFGGHSIEGWQFIFCPK
jgi:hypothetical protein